MLKEKKSGERGANKIDDLRLIFIHFFKIPLTNEPCSLTIEPWNTMGCDSYFSGEASHERRG